MADDPFVTAERHHSQTAETPVAAPSATVPMTSMPSLATSFDAIPASSHESHDPAVQDDATSAVPVSSVPLSAVPSGVGVDP